MGGHATAGGEDPLGGVHPVDVLGRGLDPHQDHPFARLRPNLRFVGGEHHLPDRRPRGGGQPLGQHGALHRRVEGGMEQLVQGLGGDPADRLLPADQPLLHHVAGDLHRRAGGALAATGLQHPELPVLDGELDVLHVPVVLLEALVDAHQRPVGLRHLLLEGGKMGLIRAATRLVDRLRGADPGDHVLALGVLQILAVEDLLAGGGVSREGDTGGAVVAHVAEHHGLDADRGSPGIGDLVDAAVANRPLVPPGAEHRADRPPELLLRVLGKGPTGVLLDGLRVAADQGSPVFAIELRVQGDAPGGLQRLEVILEAIVGNLEHDLAVHVHETAVAVVGKALAGELREPDHRFVVQTQIQDGVHHAGHRDPGTRANRDEERVFRIAEARADQLLDPGHRGQRLLLDRAAQSTPRLLELAAHLGGDGEARRHRNAEEGHLREVRALSSQELAHLAPTVRLPVAEEEDPARKPSRGPRPLPPGRSAAGPSRVPPPHLASRRTSARSQSPSSSLSLMCASSPARETRSCSMLSRSRTVT